MPYFRRNIYIAEDETIEDEIMKLFERHYLNTGERIDKIEAEWIDVSTIERVNFKIFKMYKKANYQKLISPQILASGVRRKP